MHRDKIMVGIVILLLSSPSYGKSLKLVDFEGENFDAGENSLFPGEFEGAIPPEDNFVENEVIDISSKSKSRPTITRHSISMVNTDPNAESVSMHPIKDETATTGENAKKTLPSYLRQKAETTSSPLLYGIHSMVVNPVLTSLSPGG
jgi:hypothetical protein